LILSFSNSIVATPATRNIGLFQFLLIEIFQFFDRGKTISPESNSHAIIIPNTIRIIPIILIPIPTVLFFAILLEKAKRHIPTITAKTANKIYICLFLAFYHISQSFPLKSPIKTVSLPNHMAYTDKRNKTTREYKSHLDFSFI